MVVGRLLLGSDPEQETVYRQRVGLGEREPNPDAWRSIERAANGHGTAIEDVGVDHGGLDVFMAEQFLDCSNIVPILQQMGGKAVPEGVGADALVNFGLSRCSLDGSL